MLSQGKIGQFSGEVLYTRKFEFHPDKLPERSLLVNTKDGHNLFFHERHLLQVTPVKYRPFARRTIKKKMTYIDFQSCYPCFTPTSGSDSSTICKTSFDSRKITNVDINSRVWMHSAWGKHFYSTHIYLICGFRTSGKFNFCLYHIIDLCFLCF